MNVKLNRPRNDLTGKRYGRLLVLGFAGYEQRATYRSAQWKCRCDCKNEKNVSQNQLVNGQISCGCALADYRRWAVKNFKPSNTLRKGEAALNLLYLNYKTRAKKLGVTFDLTKEEFENLTKGNCFYCNRPPLQSVIHNRIRRSFNGDYKYNGIDRLDNSIGYTKTNCESCCGICNKAKRDLTLNEFIAWIQELSQHANSINYQYGNKRTNK